MGKPDGIVTNYGLRSRNRRALQDEQAEQNPNGVHKSTGCQRIRSPSPFQKQLGKRPEKKQKAAKTAQTSRPIKGAPKKSTATKKSTAARSTAAKSTAAKGSATARGAQKPSDTDAVQDPSTTNPAQERPLDASWMKWEKAAFEWSYKRDHLIDKPTAKTSVYSDKDGNPVFDDRYVQKSQRKPPVGQRHPKILQAQKNGTASEQLVKYYEELPPKRNIPLAGIPREPINPLKPCPPAQSEPAQSEPDQSEPDQSEPDQSEPDQSEPDQSEPDQSEPDQSEPDQSEPVLERES
jgi:hypothetical protein